MVTGLIYQSIGEPVGYREKRMAEVEGIMERKRTEQKAQLSQGTRARSTGGQFRTDKGYLSSEILVKKVLSIFRT